VLRRSAHHNPARLAADAATEAAAAWWLLVAKWSDRNRAGTCLLPVLSSHGPAVAACDVTQQRVVARAGRR
jgi:hypothetical protein